MKRMNKVEEARDAARKEMIAGKEVGIEYYKNGTGWHTDTCGTFIGADYGDDPGDSIPDCALCDYRVMDKEDYANSLLANTGTDVDEYFDDLDVIVVVNLATDADGEYELAYPEGEFKKHYCIEVHHQMGVTQFECESYVDAARGTGYDSWDYTIYNSIDDAVNTFGELEDVPEELKKLLDDGPAVAVYWPGENAEHYMPLKDFDAETEAFDYLAHDLHRLIVINSVEDAREIAGNYCGHEEIKVRRAAREIMRMAAEGLID